LAEIIQHETAQSADY